MTLAAATASGQSVASEQPDSVDIRQLESTLMEALHARDRQQLELLLAPDYVLRGRP
jgi:hypothetical protein